MNTTRPDPPAMQSSASTADTDLIDVLDRMGYPANTDSRANAAELLLAWADKRAEQQVREAERKAYARHASDLARAIGLLDGLGRSDEYLTRRLALVMSKFAAPTTKEVNHE